LGEHNFGQFTKGSRSSDRPVFTELKTITQFARRAATANYRQLESLFAQCRAETLRYAADIINARFGQQSVPATFLRAEADAIYPLN